MNLEEDTSDSTVLNFYDYQLKQQQLLKIAIQFCYGSNGFQIYSTDANIVVNKSKLRLTFVDLDSLLIVDSQRKQISRHEQIDCNYCFAFILHELCPYQFKGFLH